MKGKKYYIQNFRKVQSFKQVIRFINISRDMSEAISKPQYTFVTKIHNNYDRTTMIFSTSGYTGEN